MSETSRSVSNASPSSISLPMLPPQRSWGQTTRPVSWFLVPVVVFIGLSAFVIYSTWAAFQGDYFRYGPYLSPFYSPDLTNVAPGWWPSWLRFSPALLILWAPAGFRLTCYYYRGAYYKAFWADPPSCAVGEPRKSYLGENSLPLIIQNIHRYFMYLAVIFLFFLASDAWHAMWFTDPATGKVHFGIGVGTIVLTANVCLLTGYTLGCHSLRHLIGGWRDHLSGAPVRTKLYDCSSCLNRRHMLWAWCSLFMVGFSDVYVRLCSMGIWTDWRIF
ncbi:MAG TPA: hypothetical protein VMD30_10865 [Tepidisphaeraceae bacterium]|nr:hypothetical protein [Tepidisphaeraceae bacterium]